MFFIDYVFAITGNKLRVSKGNPKPFLIYSLRTITDYIATKECKATLPQYNV
jgi:hypothetical protein